MQPTAIADPHWTAYLTALMTPVVACIAAWIAYRNYTTSRNKLKLDLFDRRYALYQELNEIRTVAFEVSEFTYEHIHRLTALRIKARWVFGQTVMNYLDLKCAPKFGEIQRLCRELNILVDKEERIAKCKGSLKFTIAIGNVCRRQRGSR